MTPSNKQKSTAELLAELRAGQATFPAAAESYQDLLAQANGEIAKLRQTPAAYPPAAGVKLFAERNAAAEIVEMLDAQEIDYLVRQYEEHFHIEHADALADALEADLAAKTAKLPERRKSFVAWLTELPSKIYSPELTEAEKDALLLERQKREDAEDALQAQIRAAKSRIVYYRANPLPSNYGGPRGIVASINLG